MEKQIHPTGAEKAIGDFSPKLVRLTDDVLFGDVWERSALSKRDRSLATITALIALRASEQLPFHLKKGIEHGLTQEEIVELITHMAFYTGCRFEWAHSRRPGHVLHCSGCGSRPIAGAH